MLVNAIPQLQTWRFLSVIRSFFRSGWYIAGIVFLMACSELFSLELYVIPAYLVLGIACVLLCEDLLGIVPIASCGYMLFAAKNNPGKFPITGLFAQQYAQEALAICIAIAVVILAVRFFTKVCERGKRRGIPKLTFGYACLAENFRAVIGAPTLSGEGSRDSLYTGWGIWNCIGAMMAFCVPAPAYFAVKKKNGWLFTLLSTVYLLGVVLTQSRGSMLAGAIVYLCGVLVTLVKSRGRERLWNFLVYAVLLAAGSVILVRYWDEVWALVVSFINLGGGDSGRFNLYEQAWGVFKEHPFFGVGWYDVPGVQYAQGGMYNNGHPVLENYFIPGFVHNTFLQMLAMGGLLAFAAYILHRTETVLLFFRSPTTAKTVSGICILAILLASIVDNHIVNLGPGLLYSIVLVFVEKADVKPRSGMLSAARP